MNLVIDIGNTLVKTAIFNEKELSSFSSFEKVSVDVLKELLKKNPSVKNVILSSVVEHSKNITDYLRSELRFVELTHETKTPIENLYQSPQTLGKDRLASAVGANLLFRNQNVLSIDAGTCIKYDFVNAKNQYLGGGISPGIEMRFKALNQFTDKLPLLNYASSLTLISQEKGTKYFNKLIGENTDESILSGVMNGTMEEVKGIIARYQQQYPDTKVVFTGGYLKFFEKTFNIGSNGKSSIFADSFLVLKGLNVILNYNVK
ncbi:MAG: type III pantothenate kinase [Bacteroidetes bacterium]|nr:type III pantothenate kinase [Bacteroidota bacterium]